VNVDSSVLLLVGVDFVFDDTTLLGSSGTTNKRSVTVEVLGNLLKRGVASLNVEEVHESELESEPDALFNLLARISQLVGKCEKLT
jgi:hypothetical protein